MDSGKVKINGNTYPIMYYRKSFMGDLDSELNMPSSVFNTMTEEQIYNELNQNSFEIYNIYDELQKTVTNVVLINLEEQFINNMLSIRAIYRQT